MQYPSDFEREVLRLLNRLNRATSVAEREPEWAEGRRTWGLPVIYYGDYPESEWRPRLIWLAALVVVAAVGAAVIFGLGYL